MNNKVSVIIPFYSGVDLLEEAIESVFAQTYKNFEIIVINDGSKEDLGKFLSTYGSKIVFLSQENKGPAAARNAAINFASGEYIAFLDSDDIWLPEKTEKQISFMKSVGAMWSHTGFYYWNSEMQVLKNVNIDENYDDVFLQSFVSLKISTPSVIIKREIFQAHSEFYFPEQLRFGQDSALFEKISQYYPLALICEPLMKVRLRGNNTNTRALVRIEFKANKFIELQNQSNGRYSEIPIFIKTILKIYYYYNILLKRTPFQYIAPKKRENLAKVLWAFPFIIERLYVKQLRRSSKKNTTYRLK